MLYILRTKICHYEIGEIVVHAFGPQIMHEALSTNRILKYRGSHSSLFIALIRGNALCTSQTLESNGWIALFYPR